ncbi:hypothetical protein [Paenibacillus sp. D51F]
MHTGIALLSPSMIPPRTPVSTICAAPNPRFEFPSYMAAYTSRVANAPGVAKANEELYSQPASGRGNDGRHRGGCADRFSSIPESSNR